MDKIYIFSSENEYKSIKKNTMTPMYRVEKWELPLLDPVSSLLVIFYHGLNLEKFDELEERLSEKQKYVYVWNIFNYLFVSNIRNKHDKGCIHCLWHRWIATKKDSKKLVELSTLQADYGKVYHEIFNIYIINFIFECIKKKSLYILAIEKNRMYIKKRRLLPVPTCKYCGNLQIDSEDLARQDLKLLIESRNKEFRKHSLIELLPNLINTYVDEEIGIINYLLDDTEAPFAVTVANLPSIMGKDEVGVGRKANYSQSKAVAVLEALERYCGLEPRGKITSIESSYDEINQEIAINPKKLGLHTNEQYENKNCPFSVYDTKETMKWVLGISVTNNELRLIPEKVAYYGLRLRDADYTNFVYEISNGCAIGGTLKEASLSGLLEVIERDAFLNTWYNEISLPELKLSSINNKEIQLMKAKFEYLFPYRLHIFDMRIDINIPLVLVVAKKNSDKNDDDMNIMCAAGIDLSWEGAIINALHELCDIYPALNAKYKERKKELEMMKDNFNLVRTMEDHSLLYGLKGMEKYFCFLFERGNVDRKDFLAEKIEITDKYSLDEVFQLLVDILAEKGLETIVINQTAEELKLTDLYCVKVLVPGMLPMTFGHLNRRVETIKRIEDIGKIYNKDKYRIIPHPFP